MRKSIAVLENSLSVVPGVTTMALLASRTQSGCWFVFLCPWLGLSFPGVRGRESGVRGPDAGCPIGEPEILAAGALWAVKAPGGRASEEARELAGGAASDKVPGE